MNGKRIIITGGAGFLGQALVARLYPQNRITVFSRDEAKHALLRRAFPNVTCVVGDIRDRALLNAACAGHDVGIFCASLKRVDAVNANPQEAAEIIVNGALNSRYAAVTNGFESACFVSTDKSRLPVTIYGSLKHAASEAFLWGSDDLDTRLSCALPGNILNSTGSLIPMIWDAIKAKREMTLYGMHMTRFLMTVEQAVDLTLAALDYRAVYLIPKLDSCYVQDIFDVYTDKFGLRYKLGLSTSNERPFEYLFSKEDAPRVRELDHNFYALHYHQTSPAPPFADELNSRDRTMNRTQLERLLAMHNYFQP
jgi:UDP-N-acetylglucosamine 4,6-dehydratase